MPAILLPSKLVIPILAFSQKALTERSVSGPRSLDLFSKESLVTVSLPFSLDLQPPIFTQAWSMCKKILMNNWENRLTLGKIRVICQMF